MPEIQTTKVAVVDYGLGNLFSVQQACEHVGLSASVTNSRSELMKADAVILPGVGAFGRAMLALRQLDLVSLLKDFAAAGKPLFGVCLGMQLLMTESEEFGVHQGLNIISGRVVRFDVESGGRCVKVPQVGWNHIFGSLMKSWTGTPLEGVAEGEYMYFVHSYHVRPEDENVTLAKSTYGGVEFCAALKVGNIFACQFHPERSGEHGLSIYRNLARQLVSRLEHEHV